MLLNKYAVIKADEQQYAAMDKDYILYRKKENYGYSCLTNERQFYQENYPELVMEKGSVDDVILIVMRGESV